MKIYFSIERFVVYYSKDKSENFFTGALKKMAEWRLRLIFFKSAFFLFMLTGLFVGCSPVSTSCKKCKLGEVRCSADQTAVETCQFNSTTQCLEFQAKQCPTGQQCNPNVHPAKCEDLSTCTHSCKIGERRCDGEVLMSCQQPPGAPCPLWKALQVCPQDQHCDANLKQCVADNCQPTNPQSLRKCVGNAVYWFDDCGKQGALIKACSAQEKCVAGQCISQNCQPTNAQAVRKCVGNAAYWFDDCGKQGMLIKACSAQEKCVAGQCVSQGCQPTNAQAVRKCVGNAAYWFDDCGKQGALIKACSAQEKCVSGQCVAQNTCKNQCQAGSTRCQGAAVQSCQKDGQGCYVWGQAIPCSSGMTCSNGSCVPSQNQKKAIGAACRSGRDCQGGICISNWPSGGYCSAKCGSSPCPSGAVCTKLQSQQGMVLLCLKDCSHTSCRSGYKCYQNKICVPGQSPSGCTSDAQCPRGQKCQNGTCRTPPCRRDSDCPSGQKCQSGVCTTPNQGGGAGKIQTRNLVVDGQQRTYLLYVYRNYTGKTPVPLLIAVHGAGDTASNYIQTSRWKSVADQGGFLLAVPHKAGGRWNYFTSPQTDAHFMDAIVKDVLKNFKANRKKVYIVGFSQGGYFTYCYAINRPHLYAGMGIQSAANPTNKRPQPARKIAVAFVIGTRDSAYSRAKANAQQLKQDGHPVLFISIPNAGHCCAAQHDKNVDVWNFLKKYSIP